MRFNLEQYLMRLQPGLLKVDILMEDERLSAQLGGPNIFQKSKKRYHKSNVSETIPLRWYLVGKIIDELKAPYYLM
jgi:malate synthase